jgi:GT2 family glycosyltransferase
MADPAMGHVANQPDLSVVIVTYNAVSLIGPCLGSLLASCTGLQIEVFVVDNGSSDGTPEMLRKSHPWISLQATGRNLGFSAGNNLALPLCQGRAVMLLNPDTVVSTGAVKELLAHLRTHPEAGAVGPKLRLRDGSIQPECARRLPAPGNLLAWLLLLDKLAFMLRPHRTSIATNAPPPPTWYDGFNLLTWPREKACAVESICGACIVLRREVLQQVGLLDESSPMYLDDIDYCRRILDAGWTIHYAPSSVITHLWQQSSNPRRAGDHYGLGCHAIWLYLHKHHGAAAGHGFAIMAAFAAAVRLPIAAFLALWPGPAQRNRVRRLRMAQGLARWAWHLQKRPPLFGFANESRTDAAGAPGAPAQ